MIRITQKITSTIRYGCGWNIRYKFLPAKALSLGMDRTWEEIGFWSRWMETQRLRGRFRSLQPYFDGRITWSRFPQRQPCPLSAGIYLFADDIGVNCVNEA